MSDTVSFKLRVTRVGKMLEQISLVGTMAEISMILAKAGFKVSVGKSFEGEENIDSIVIDGSELKTSFQNPWGEEPKP